MLHLLPVMRPTASLLLPLLSLACVGCGDDDPAGEFADVLAWLCTLANINGVDLETAIKAKYFDGGGPKGFK